MQELTEIIKILNPSEVRLVRKFYKMEPGKEQKKRLELFNLVKNGMATTNAEAASMLYNAKPSSKFSHLKSRLKADILNIMLMQEGASKYSAPYRQATFDCQKLYMEGEMLIARGARNSGEKALKDALKIAEEYHLTFEMILIQDMLRTQLGTRQGLKAYKMFDDSIHLQMEILQDLITAKEYFYHVGLPNTFFKNKQHEFLQYAQSAIKDIQKMYIKNKSPHIGYYYYYLAIFYSEIKKDFKGGLAYALKFLELIITEEALRSNSRHALAHIQIAGLAIQTKQHSQAVEHAKKALQISSPETYNSILAMEMLFFANLYMSKFQAAESILNDTQNIKFLKRNKFLKEKWLYFKANLHFYKREFDEALQILRKQTTLMKDKSGWFMGWQMLELMCHIEEENDDILGYRIESFKKLVQRQKYQSIKRVISAYKILEQVIKLDFDYEAAYNKKKEELDLLIKADDEYSWDPLGFEIVRFDTWFNSKLPAVVEQEER